jgi:glycosyltransferase involved in cell wall biosynthesis
MKVDGADSFDIVYVPLGSQAYGGAERSLLDLATRFAARGERVLILVGPELAQTDFVHEANRRGLALQQVAWTHHRSRWYNLRATVAKWRQLKPRLVHFNISWHPHMWLVALCARVLTSAKLIGSMRAMPDPHDLVPRRKYLGLIPGLQLWRIPDMLRGWLWGHILHCTVAVNARDFSRRLIAHFGYPPERLAVVYNGIDINAPKVSREETGELRRSAGISDDDFLVVFVGRLSEEKGTHLLLQAVAPLPASVRLVLVGDGPQRPALELLVDDLGLRARVVIAGYTPNPERWMAAANVVAVPSTWYEAFGRVVVEAMNQGTPVVASRIGGMAELFEDGVHGCYVTAGSIEELQRAIALLAKEPDRAKAMGEKAKILVGERYSLDRVQAEYGKLYAELLLNGGVARPAATSNP